MARPDLVDGVMALRWMLDFARLERLDNLWTAYLQERDPIPARDADALDRITGEIRDLLGMAPSHAEGLQNFIRANRQQFEDAFQLILTSARLDDGDRDRVREISRLDGLGTFAIEQLDIIRADHGQEAATLQEKMAVIHKGGVPEGDFKFRFECALGVAWLAAAVALAVSSGMVLVPAVLAAAKLSPMAVAAALGGGATFFRDVKGGIEKFADLIKKGCFGSTPR
jgi:hypothetical protein